METTKEAARQLGLSAAALRAHIAAGNVTPPKRRAGLMFLWTPEEIAAARAALSEPGRRRPHYMAKALTEGGKP